jgi:hypothetical protein
MYTAKFGYEPEGREFESLRARHSFPLHHKRLRSVALTESWGTLGDNFEVEANSDALRLRFAEGHILTEFRVLIGNAFFQKPGARKTKQISRTLSRPCTCGNP